MDIKEETICRICLKVVETVFEAVNRFTTKMLDVLLLKMNLEANINPIICQNCSKVIRKCFNFKLGCVTTEEIILSFAVGRKGAKLDMKNVYKDCKDVAIVGEDFSICRFCMNQVETGNIVSLDALLSETTFTELLTAFLPGMDFSIIENPVICTPCRKNLGCYFQLAQNCLDTEEKIAKYAQSEAANNTEQINLNDILHFSNKDIIKSENFSEIPAIKKEENFWEDMDSERSDGYEKLIKTETKMTEETNIKDEDTNLYENFCESSSDKSQTNISLRDTASQLQVYKCELCSYVTSEKVYLTKHVNFHTDSSEVEMYKCTTCTFETKYKHYIKRHMLTHKDPSMIEMYKCFTCTYETKHKKDLKRHVLLHKDVSEVATYKCALCIFQTRHKHGLKDHMLIHKDASEVEMHKCELCTYETRYKTHLKTHMLIHQGASEIEMQKCSECSFETRYKKSLKSHMLKHVFLKGQVYKCEHCAFETKNKKHLKKHLVTQVHLNS